jgi:hypothetical protein
MVSITRSVWSVLASHRTALDCSVLGFSNSPLSYIGAKNSTNLRSCSPLVGAGVGARDGAGVGVGPGEHARRI